MDFLQDFLFNNVSNNFTDFLTKFDAKNNTHYALTVNHQSARIEIIKRYISLFLQNTNIKQAVQDEYSISGKINILINLLIQQLIEEKRGQKFATTLNTIYKHSIKDFTTTMMHIADKFWNFIDVYDEDINFYTRRIKLSMLISEKIAQNFDAPRMLCV